MSNQSELLDIISTKHRESGLSHAAFAQQLGVSKSMVFAVLNGHRHIGRKFLSGLVTCYPELQPEVLRYLRSN